MATLGTSSFSGGNPHTATYNCSEDGEYTITAIATDLAGNKAAEQTKTFKVDSKAPVLKVTAVDLAGNISEKTVIFNISAPKPADPNKNPGNSQDKPNPGNNQSKPGTGNTSSSIGDNSEKPVNVNNTNGINNTVANANMPKTGSMVNATSILLASIMLIVAGAAIINDKKKKASK